MTNLAENTVVKPKTNSHQLVIKPKKNSHHPIDQKMADDSSIDELTSIPAISHQNASSEGGEGVTAEESVATDTHSQPESDLDALSAPEDQALKVGDKAFWSECPAHCSNFAPFEIMAIDGDYAKLDLFEKPVPIAELSR